MENALETEAAQLFEEGKSVSAVAKALKISWYKAQKLKPASAEAENVEAPEPADETEAEDAPQLVFPISLEIPVEQVDEAIAAVSDMELRDAVIGLGGSDKANILQIVLQARLTALLNPSNSGGEPELTPNP
jgi:hypothetical protein